MDCVGKIFVVPVLLDSGLELLCSQVLKSVDVVLHSHGEDFGVLDKVDLWAERRSGLFRRGHARSGPLGCGLLDWGPFSQLLRRRRRTVLDFNHSRNCNCVVIVEVVQVIKVADHQLHNLGVVAGIFGIIGVRVYGFELDGASLALLSWVSRWYEPVLVLVVETYLERVCLHRRPEVLGVNANCELVDLEAVWAADDGAIRVFFALEVAWIEVSICISREGG